ncbi:MAG: hypothetical protein ACLP8S_28230 [Solirubrobacteraceae bacterium]
MAKFLVTYHRAAMSTDGATVEQARAAIDTWLAAAGSAVIDPGAPVRALTQLAGDEPEPRSTIDGYSLIQADSIEAASDLLRSHPFLAGGGTLQINEVLNG